MLKTKQTEKQAFTTLTSHLKEVVECNNNMLELKEFNIIIISVIKRKHFYIICFDLENAKVEVIDNMASNHGFYRMSAGTKFKENGMPSKVKNYMVGYLMDVKHPSAARVAAATLTKKKLEWAMRDNFNDCGMFTMRHMELYKGSDVEFECGFSTRKNIQDMQLQNLRMKIATKLILSEANVYKRTVMYLARKATQNLRDKRMRKMLEKEGAKQEKCWHALSEWKNGDKV
ncbi:putative Ulp1 protease family catalytic domain, papain-like cysteine peptidase superfamily [Helianthus annuus]|nr:putative Ulp1 protease family catalytic domain, papain-like cysteine peptidase superfamily [Helianthus annuus]